jgi:hypothetical protein
MVEELRTRRTKPKEGKQNEELQFAESARKSHYTADYFFYRKAR